MKARHSVWRGSLLSLPSLTFLTAALLQASCGVGPWTLASLPGPERPAERRGPWMTTVALYDPVLFGPELPLAHLIREHRLPLLKGKLKDTSLLVNKAQRRLELWVRHRMVKAYRIQLSLSAHGPKMRQGDRRIPEGRYFICAHRPSRYYLALWLAYPNLDDARRGLGSGLIEPAQYRAIAERLANRACPPQDTRLGGDIVIHGQLPGYTAELARAHRAHPGSLRPGSQIGDADPAAVLEFQDWTDGCVALFNLDIRELYEYVPDGAEVMIVANARVTAPRKAPSAPRPPDSSGFQGSGGRIAHWSQAESAAAPVPFIRELSGGAGFPAHSWLRLARIFEVRQRCRGVFMLACFLDSPGNRRREER